MPPMPSAMSRPSEPVGSAGMSPARAASPSRMIAPLPNCFSIWLSARSIARSRFTSMLMWRPPPAGVTVRCPTLPSPRPTLQRRRYLFSATAGPHPASGRVASASYSAPVGRRWLRKRITSFAVQLPKSTSGAASLAALTGAGPRGERTRAMVTWLRNGRLSGGKPSGSSTRSRAAASRPTSATPVGMPAHSTRGRARLGKPPSPASARVMPAWAAAVVRTASATGASAASGTSPRNLRVTWSPAGATQRRSARGASRRSDAWVRSRAARTSSGRSRATKQRTVQLGALRPEELRVDHRLPERVAAQPVERDLRGEELHPVARAPELVVPGDRAVRRGERQPQGAGGFLGRGRLGTGDAGGREPEVRPDDAPHAGGHLGGRLLADRPVRVEGFPADPEQLLLDAIGVGDDGAAEVRGAARHVGDAVPDEASRQRLGQRQRELPLAQQPADHLLERDRSLAVHVGADALADARREGLEPGRGGGRLAVDDDAQRDLREARPERDAGFGGLDDAGNHLVERRLAEPEGLEDACQVHVAPAQRAQPGQHGP